MADIKISDLNLNTEIKGDEFMVIVQDGETKKVPSNEIRTPQGWAVYDNANAANQTLPIDTFVPMTNDGLESTTNIVKLPIYTPTLFSSNRVQLTSVPENNILTLRIVATLIALSPNTEFDSKLVFRNSGGTIIFESVLGHNSFKTTGSRTFTDVAIFFLGSVIVNGTVEFQIKADTAAEARFNGILISIP